MFYIDDQIDTKNRYALGKFLEYFSSLEAVDSTTSYFLQQIKKLPKKGKYTVALEEYHPEYISEDIYDVPYLWWVLLIYNDLTSFENVTLGSVLSYPELADLESTFFALRAMASQEETTSRYGRVRIKHV